MPSKAQHVVPRDGKWAVRKSGADRITRLFGTQREALEAARDIARKQGTELYIYGRDGRIRERESYGKEPVPSKG
jgi:hypothetical protein